MSFKAKSLGLLLGLAATASATALAQTDDGASEPALPANWTYDECVEYAKANNITLKQTQLTWESGNYDLEAARAQWFPTLDFSTSHGFTNYPSPADGQRNNTYSGSYGLNAGWTVYNGGKRQNTIKQQELSGQVNSLAVDAVYNNLETEIMVCYLQILYAREAIGIAKQTCEVSLVQKERAYALMEAGKLSRVDYIELESQYLTDEYNVVTAESTYRSRKLELKQLLELGIEVDMEIPDLTFSEEDVLQPLPDKSTVYYAAISWLPEIQSLLLQEDISDLDIKIAKAGYYPTISLSASVGTGTNSGSDYNFGDQLLNNLNENIGISLSIPILDNKTNKTAVAKAKIAKMNTQLDYESKLVDVAQTVESYHIEATNAQAQYISGKKQLESAELTDELTNEQFKLGMVNILELLSSHNTLLSARQQLLQSKYTAIMNIKMLEFYQNQGINL